jgi:hypothetical protein
MLQQELSRSISVFFIEYPINKSVGDESNPVRNMIGDDSRKACVDEVWEGSHCRFLSQDAKQ